MRILLLFLLVVSTPAVADIADLITRAAIGDAKLSAIDVAGKKHLVIAKKKWFGGNICYWFDPETDIPCIMALSGQHYVRDLPTLMPQCVISFEQAPIEVKQECLRLAPPVVVSSLTGSRPLYDGAAMYAWAQAKDGTSIPKKKIGTVATQTPCGPNAAAIDGKTVWWWTRNADGLYGAAYCK